MTLTLSRFTTTICQADDATLCIPWQIPGAIASNTFRFGVLLFAAFTAHIHHLQHVVSFQLTTSALPQPGVQAKALA